MQRIAFAVAATAAILCTPLPAQAQKMDTAVMARWSSAKVVGYKIVGVYEGRVNVVGGSKWIGYADVTDRVEIDLAWDPARSKLVGTPTFRNTKSVVGNLRNFESKCLPPVLKGEYEHYELQGLKESPDGNLVAQVLTTYPGAEVAQLCTGKREAVPASRDLRSEEFGVISPVAFGMPLPDSDELRVSPDKKSLITKRDGWTWTFTPSIQK
jgi:hypothetical protein